jgi:heptosyltransferase-1
MTQPRRILIVRTSSLGDIIHTLPAFQSLRAAHPEGRVDWLVESRAAFLLKAVPGLDRIVTIDTRTVRSAPWDPGSWQHLWRTIRAIRKAH